jgi:acetyl-CoA carboxylase biotin carboxyl carrier protein
MLSHADIERLAAWLAATDIGALELRSPAGAIRLERRDNSFGVSQPVQFDAAATTSITKTICADTPGLFLHSHPLRTVPLVEVGAVVAPGQLIGLLQVGPLLFPVRASCAGRIEGYYVEHWAAVGYGTPLIALSETPT